MQNVNKKETTLLGRPPEGYMHLDSNATQTENRFLWPMTPHFDHLKKQTEKKTQLVRFAIFLRE